MTTIQDRIIEIIKKHNNDVMSFPTPRELLNANKRLEQFLIQSIKLVEEETRKEVVEECKQKMAQSNEWWNKKLLSITNKEKQK